MMPSLAPIGRQHGAALLAALCVVLMLLLLGASAARTAHNAEKAARGERDQHIALQAAEAALADAERDIEGGADPGSARAAMFAPGSAAGFAAGCGAGRDNPALGLCLRAPPPARPAWQLANLAGEGGVAVEYGRFTGAALPVGKAPFPARRPRYIIELLPYARAGRDAGRRAANFYRITAIGFGASEASRVVLQTYYLKVAPAGEAP